MRNFMVLLGKELRELVTFQMLAPFVAIIFIFIALGNVIGSAGDEAGTARVVVLDHDGSEASAVITSSLADAGLEVIPLATGSLDDAVAGYAPQGVGLFVEVPSGFEQTLAGSTPASVRLRTVMTDFSFLGMRGSAEVQGGLTAANQRLATAIAATRAPGVPMQMLQQPIALEQDVTIGDRTATTTVDAVAAFIGQQTTFIPIVLFIVIVFAAQMIATTIATEKENKTLETLLSYPVSRTALVTSKMVAAGLISLVAAGAYMLGMQQYLAGLEASMGHGLSGVQGSQEIMSQLGLVFGLSDYVMLGLSLFAGILLALSIAIILGAFAESVKAVGALITPLMVLLLVPYMLTMFVNLSTASPLLKWGLLAIPFTHPFLAAQNLFLGNRDVVWMGIGYQMLWFVAFALIAARIFSSDRVLTMKLDLRRRKRTPAE